MASLHKSLTTKLWCYFGILTKRNTTNCRINIYIWFRLSKLLFWHKSCFTTQLAILIPDSLTSISQRQSVIFPLSMLYRTCIWLQISLNSFKIHIESIFFKLLKLTFNKMTRYKSQRLFNVAISWALDAIKDDSLSAYGIDLYSWIKYEDLLFKT